MVSRVFVSGLLAACGLTLAGCGAIDSGSDSAVVTRPLGADPARLSGYVHFLADDATEGREAGTRGYDLAAAFVASQFSALGLEPGGDRGSWLQEVPLLRGTRLREGAEFSVARGEDTTAFGFQSEFLPGVNYQQPSWRLSAPMVFVGQAVVAPEFDHDDLAGVDLNGKIAIVLSGAPERFPNDPRAFYSHSREKQRLLAKRGAVGVVYVGDPVREAKSPWARGAANWARPSMRLRDADGNPVDIQPTLVATASLSAAAAERLFDGAMMTAEEVFTRLEKGSLKPFDLVGTATLAGTNELSPMLSHNVVAHLPGNDPQRADQQIVFSAHLDHLGIGAPVNGDAIYNGALDNALGVGLLLETARLARHGPPSARGRVFVALTAEEKGLLGAEQFAASPSVPGKLVANINMDMPMVLGAQTDILPIGIEHSSMQVQVEAAAQQVGVSISADPFPEEVVFVRSDQYAFIMRGIPAVYIKGGIVSADPNVDGKQLMSAFLREHYHQPSDQVDLPIHYESAAKIADINHRVGLAVGNDANPPHWNEGDFFGERFAGGK